MDKWRERMQTFYKRKYIFEFIKCFKKCFFLLKYLKKNFNLVI